MRGARRQARQRNTSSMMRTRRPRTSEPNVPGASSNHCLQITEEFAVFVASSYSSREMARIGFCTSVRSIRAGMKPPPPIATDVGRKRLNLGHRTAHGGGDLTVGEVALAIGREEIAHRDVAPAGTSRRVRAPCRPGILSMCAASCGPVVSFCGSPGACLRHLLPLALSRLPAHATADGGFGDRLNPRGITF